MSYTGLKLIDRKNEDHLIPDHIYYDLNVTNNDTTNTTPLAPVLQFNEIRSSTFLQNPSDYYLSIVRFQVDTTSLPLFIPQVDITQNNPNQLIYKITLSFGAFSFTQPLIFSPQDLTQVAPTPPFTSDQYANPYYYIYNIQKFIFDTVNSSFVLAFLGLLALTPLPTAIPPFIEFDPFTNYCILNCDILGYKDTLATPIKIFFNANLYQLFNSFSANYLGVSNTNRAYQLNITDTNNTNVIVFPTYSAIQVYQEFSTIAEWNPVKSFIFTSNLLPVNQSLEGDPIVFGDGGRIIESSTLSAYSNILTDYQVELIKGNETRPLVQYVPTAEYRLFDLVGNNPLGTINLQCFWKDRFGLLVPFQLRTGCSASIKLMFRMKKYANQ
jgi:hypothetical protein